MAKRQKAMNIYPGLAAEMARHGHDNFKLADIIGTSYNSVLRRISGEVQFKLTEIKTLMATYNVSFDELFGETRKTQTA